MQLAPSAQFDWYLSPPGSGLRATWLTRQSIAACFLLKVDVRLLSSAKGMVRRFQFVVLRLLTPYQGQRQRVSVFAAHLVILGPHVERKRSCTPLSKPSLGLVAISHALADYAAAEVCTGDYVIMHSVRQWVCARVYPKHHNMACSAHILDVHATSLNSVHVHVAGSNGERVRWAVKHCAFYVVQALVQALV